MTSPAGAAHVTPIGSQRGTTGIEPYSLVAGPDGDLYFAFSKAFTDGFDGIGRIDPATGQVVLASTGRYVPVGIAFGSEGALWFADRTHNLIGRVPVSGLASQPVAGS